MVNRGYNRAIVLCESNSIFAGPGPALESLCDFRLRNFRRLAIAQFSGGADSRPTSLLPLHFGIGLWIMATAFESYQPWH
jgi:hypothetical protein